MVVSLIQVVYDVLWGPDPARFGFWTNFLYHGTLTTVHLVVAAAIIHLAIVLEARTPRSSNG
jgi:hypothetical protein